MLCVLCHAPRALMRHGDAPLTILLCGIVVVAWWRLLLWDTGTHQSVSEAGEGIRAFEGGFVSLGGGSCAAVLACGDRSEGAC